MALEPETVELALKRVDRSKRFIIIAIVLLLVAVLVSYFGLLHTSRVVGGGVSKAAFVALGTQMAFVGLCAILIAFHVTRMTKIVLNAIELSRK